MRRLIPAITAVAIIAGGVAVYSAHDAVAYDVTLTVDGNPTTLTTLVPTVGQVLATRHVEVGPHDTVSPAMSAPVRSGTRITVRYGRPVTVVDGGRSTMLWTTASTVEEALEVFGVPDDAQVSSPRSALIGRQGLTIDVDGPHADAQGPR